MSKNKMLRIAGASGYWGESSMATPQLLKTGALDYIIYDYLAEITMSILARAYAKDPKKGFATDFVDFVMQPHLDEIAQSKVKIISNAGGVNPKACAQRIEELIAKKNLSLKVATIVGDNLLNRREELAATSYAEMFTSSAFPDVDKIASINAYLGAFPIAKALAMGADIVITGRSVDSAVTLGACIHEFGWTQEDWDLLAAGSLAGHIIECGPQCTGGNFTDWEDVDNIANIGYPIAHIESNGTFSIRKPDDTGGLVSVGTISEQLLYEIGDPKNYLLPDVTCDFSQVTITQVGENIVEVKDAKGRPAPPDYKTCLTYADGFKAGNYLTFYGIDATRKAQKFEEAAMTRAKQRLRGFNLGEYTEISNELIGGGSQIGQKNQINLDAAELRSEEAVLKMAADQAELRSEEVILKMAVKHPDSMACAIFLKELAGLALASPPGLSGFTGVRAKPTPVVRLFSFTLPKSEVEINIDFDGELHSFHEKNYHTDEALSTTERPHENDNEASFDIVSKMNESDIMVVPLIKLAWGRSGDKGDKSNIGIIARHQSYLPYIDYALTTGIVREKLSHFMSKNSKVEKYYLPGTSAINFLIDHVLGGGGAASLRNDPQGKGYAQILLSCPVKISAKIVNEVIQDV